MRLLGIIWNTVYKYKLDILHEISSYAKIIAYYDVSLPKEQLGIFIKKLYGYSTEEQWKSEWKTKDLSTFSNRTICIVEIDIEPGNNYFWKEKNRTLDENVYKLKQHIRSLNYRNIKIYSENIFHLTDNEIEYWHQIKIIRNYFHKYINIPNFVDTKYDAYVYDCLPPYSISAMKYLHQQFSNLNEIVIAEIGCGTGKATLDLLSLGFTVYGIEPDLNMLEVCDKKCCSFNSYRGIIGTEANTNLLNESVDGIVIAQSFHKFDMPSFLQEAKRILRDNMIVTLIWNRYDFSNPVLNSMFKCFRKYFPYYPIRYKNDNYIDEFNKEIQENEEQAKKMFKNNCKIIYFENSIKLGYNDFLLLAVSLHIFPIKHSLNSISSQLMCSNKFPK